VERGWLGSEGNHILAHRWRNIFQFFNTFGWQQQNAAHIFTSCQHISCEGGRGDGEIAGGMGGVRWAGMGVAACAVLAMLQRQHQQHTRKT